MTSLAKTNGHPVCDNPQQPWPVVSWSFEARLQWIT